MKVQLEERIIAGLVPVLGFALLKQGFLLLPLALLLTYLVFKKVTMFYIAEHIARFSDAAFTALFWYLALFVAAFAASVISSDSSGAVPGELSELFFQLSILFSTVYFNLSVLFLAVIGFMGKDKAMVFSFKPFQTLTKSKIENKASSVSP